MGYPKGKERHWFVEFLWDFTGCALVGTLFLGIGISALWIALQIILGIFGGR